MTHTGEHSVTFSLDEFVREARAAAAQEHSVSAVNRLMARTFADPGAISAAVQPMGSGDEPLFEDEQVSVYWVSFAPQELVPPHNHKMPAFLGVYQGVEVNRLYRRSKSGSLEAVKEKRMQPGDTLSLGGEGIHAVYAEGNAPSLGLHIYLGRLSTIEREVFDSETGEAMPFTTKNYQNLLRPLE